MGSKKRAQLNPDKTHVGDCLVQGQGFKFLGYRFEAGKRWVRKKSLQGFKDKVHQKTARSRGDSALAIIGDLTAPIRGWFGYFKHADKRTFPPLAKCVLRQLGLVHHDASAATSEPIPIRKPLTGEPCAGKPQARFGGRRAASFSIPIGFSVLFAA